MSVEHSLGFGRSIIGTYGNNDLRGTAGDDYLSGGDGVDLLYGNLGNDTLSGKDGNDLILGGTGADILTGGNGADKFIYAFTDSLSGTTTQDRISDFNPGQGDRIYLPNLPTAAFNAGPMTAASLTDAILAAFNDADPNTARNQPLGANQAVFFKYGATALKSTYLAVNDSSSAFDAASDLFINVTGLVGTLPTGALTVSNYFAV